MKSHEIAMILTAIFTFGSMIAVSTRAYVAYRELKWKQENAKKREENRK